MKMIGHMPVDPLGLEKAAPKGPAVRKCKHNTATGFKPFLQCIERFSGSGDMLDDLIEHNQVETRVRKRSVVKATDMDPQPKLFRYGADIGIGFDAKSLSSQS